MAERGAGRSVIYGVHAVGARLAEGPQGISRVVVQQGRRARRVQEIVAKAGRAGLRVEERPRSALDELTEGGRHQGVAATLEQAEKPAGEKELEALLDRCEEAPLLLLLDQVQDPRNLGACLRSAAAAGVHAVIVPRDRSASLTAGARKTAVGAAEVVPLIRVTNLARTMGMLANRGIWIVGADAEADAALYDVDLGGPLALALGGEERGLRRLTRERCDCLVRIPIGSAVASLNVSVSAGVCLFEALRQRRQLQHGSR